MPEETLVVVCPNPKCQREIEPITLTVLSLAKPKEYEACPYCFARIEHEPPVAQEELPEPTIEEQTEFMDEPEDTSLLSEEEKDSAASIVGRVRALIPRSNGTQEKNGKTVPQPEPLVEEPETEQATKEPPKEETSFTGCKNSFGYLAKRDPKTPIPQECMMCPKIVDCMLKI